MAVLFCSLAQTSAKKIGFRLGVLRRVLFFFSSCRNDFFLLLLILFVCRFLGMKTRCKKVQAKLQTLNPKTVIINHHLQVKFSKQGFLGTVTLLQLQLQLPLAFRLELVNCMMLCCLPSVCIIYYFSHNNTKIANFT